MSDTFINNNPETRRDTNYVSTIIFILVLILLLVIGYVIFFSDDESNRDTTDDAEITNIDEDADSDINIDDFEQNTPVSL